MEVEDRTRLYGEEHAAKAPSDALSDVLLGAYNALREVPAKLVGALGVLEHATSLWGRSWWLWMLLTRR
jgi:hypothetical protein